MGNIVNEKLREVVNGNGTFRRFQENLGCAVLVEKEDYGYMVRYEDKVFVLHTTESMFECPVKDVEWRILWDKLGDVPVNEEDELEEPFQKFPAGSDKLAVWHWFEDTFDISLGKELFE